MVSNELTQKHYFEEFIIFPIWQKADEKEKEKICKKLGESQAKDIIKEIKSETEL